MGFWSLNTVSHDPLNRRNQNMKRFGLIFASIFSLITIAACNTVEGAGRDIEATGEAIQDGATGN
jgi:entericidin B